MIHLVLPSAAPQPLPFYLAVEEWAARVLPPAEYFFAWRVYPTVICGRCQDIAAEVNLAYCNENGIDVVRRRSGGGCVFADMDNLMLSYITPSESVSVTFSKYTRTVCSFLHTLGLNAVATGRNDILVGGSKIAGNAFYHLPQRSIVHGTLLVDIDSETMSRAITPSRAKLTSKGIVSVPSRVTSLHAQGISLDVEEIEQRVIDYLCDEEYILTADDISAIETIAQEYRRPEFLRGRGFHELDFTEGMLIKKSMRFEGVGEIEAAIVVDNSNLIKSISLSGDFFIDGDVDHLLRQFHGVEYSHLALSDVCNSIDCSAIHALRPHQLLNLITHT